MNYLLKAKVGRFRALLKYEENLNILHLQILLTEILVSLQSQEEDREHKYRKGRLQTSTGSEEGSAVVSGASVSDCNFSQIQGWCSTV